VGLPRESDVASLVLDALCLGLPSPSKHRWVDHVTPLMKSMTD